MRPHVPLGFPHTRVWSGRSEFFEIEIVDLPDEGRALFLDSTLQSTAACEAVFHRALVRPALDVFAQEGPRDVLILGAGECATMRDVLEAASVERVVATDIDAMLLQAVRQHMPEWHAGSMDDPRVELRIEDVRDTLAQASEASFDLVIVDLTDASDAGFDHDDVAPKLDRGFFEAVKRALRPNGVVTAMAGECNPPAAAGMVSPISAILKVFGNVDASRVDIPAFGGEWMFALARKSLA